MEFTFNQIESIHVTAFTGLTTMTSIFLDHNNLTELPEDLFAPLTDIRYQPFNFLRWENLR